MKIKVFLAAILAMAIVSCNKDNGTGGVSVDGEKAFVKVNLKQVGDLTKDQKKLAIQVMKVKIKNQKNILEQACDELEIEGIE